MAPGTDSSGLVSWVVERKIPLIFFLTLCIQTVGFGIWIGTMQTMITAHERLLDDLGRERITEKIAQVNGRIDTLIALAQNTDRQLDRLDARVSRLGERP